VPYRIKEKCKIKVKFCEVTVRPIINLAGLFQFK